MRSRTLPILVPLLGLLAVLVTESAGAVELRDAELVAGGSPVLQNGTGTVRLEDARLGRLGPPVFAPEPGVLWQLGAGIGFLALVTARRRATGRAGALGRPDPATSRKRMP